MNIAAMILGILGGLAGLTLSGLGAGLASFGGHSAALGGLLLFAMPIASIVGGGIALRHPGFGGILMLLSVLGWGALGSTAGSVLNFITMPPMVLSGIGFILTLFCSGGSNQPVQQKVNIHPYREPEPADKEDDEWRALVKYNDTIREAVAIVAPLGVAAVAKFRKTYKIVNNEQKAIKIANDIVAEWTSEDAEHERSKELAFSKISNMPIIRQYRGIDIRHGDDGLYIHCKGQIRKIDEAFGIENSIDYYLSEQS